MKHLIILTLPLVALSVSCSSMPKFTPDDCALAIDTANNLKTMIAQVTTDSEQKLADIEWYGDLVAWGLKNACVIPDLIAGADRP